MTNPRAGAPMLHKYYNPREAVESHGRDLPHWQQGDTTCIVTWRLVDALPIAKLNQWKAEKAEWMLSHPEPWDDETEIAYYNQFGERIDKWLDQGIGECVLKQPPLAQELADTLHFDDGQILTLFSYVIMPNHVHVLFAPHADVKLADILQTWKGVSNRKIHKHLGRKGRLWQAGYWDRLIRSERHFQRCLDYIRENPVKAGLTEGFVFWEHGSPRPWES